MHMLEVRIVDSVSEWRCKVANETEQEAVERRATDRLCKAKKRANETEQECVGRRAGNKQSMSEARRNETEQHLGCLV